MTRLSSQVMVRQDLELHDTDIQLIVSWAESLGHARGRPERERRAFAPLWILGIFY